MPLGCVRVIRLNLPRRHRRHSTVVFTWALVGLTTDIGIKMPVITLPDGSQRSFDQAVSIFDVAMDIGPGLAKAALAGKIGGELVDTSYVIEDDVELAIILSLIHI